MKSGYFLFIAFLSATRLFGQDSFQLAPPIIKYHTVFFKKENKADIIFAQQATAIHYTTNGKEPTINDGVYTIPIRIKKNFTTLKAKVFGTGFLASETAQVTFIKDGIAIKDITNIQPNEKYSGEGANTLIDNKGGSPSIQSKTWLGFREDSVVFTIVTAKKQEIKSIMFQLLQDYKSWIFFPDKVEVFGNMEKLGELLIEKSEHSETQLIKPFLIPFAKKINTGIIQLKIYTCNKIPDWHPGKGTRGWLFIDEIKIY